MKIEIDGNDGTGKTTLASTLRLLGHSVRDRGLLTKMTDGATDSPDPDTLYILLDAPPEICQERLRKAGKNLLERYHTLADLSYYRDRFLEAAKLIPGCAVIDAAGDEEMVQLIALMLIYEKQPR